MLRNALGMCKSKAGRSESVIGVLKTGPNTLAITRGTVANISRHSTTVVRSPPIRERQSAIGVLRNALGTFSAVGGRRGMRKNRENKKRTAIHPKRNRNSSRDGQFIQGGAALMNCKRSDERKFTNIEEKQMHSSCSAWY